MIVNIIVFARESESGVVYENRKKKVARENYYTVRSRNEIDLGKKKS